MNTDRMNEFLVQVTRAHPDDQEEGVRVGEVQASLPQAGQAPGPVGTRWPQMGD